MLPLDVAQIRGITEYMFVEDSILDANATLVLGTSLWERPFNRALELYRSGLSGVLVFSGGFNPKIGGSEALAMQNRWINLGLPGQHILVDSASTNTRENMINTRHLLEEGGLLNRGTKINLISINYHMRRAVETFKDVFGCEVCLGVSNYLSKYCSPRDWFKDPVGSVLILSEVRKIKTYLPKAASLYL